MREADPFGETVQLMAPDAQMLNTESMPAEITSSGGTRLFRWSPDAVRRLDQEVEWALTSNPTGAAEVAGVLLGKIGATIEITDCQPVFLMHAQDHAYALTGPGKREFERMRSAFRIITWVGVLPGKRPKARITCHVERINRLLANRRSCSACLLS